MKILCYFELWIFLMIGLVLFQPVGFVTFNTRAGAEAAKQDLQVGMKGH